MSTIKITRLRVKNYRGIEALDTEIPDLGVVIKGRSSGGKTSALKSIRAALAAQDIGADAIRNGADSAEILVDIDDVTVRRAITRKSSTLTITTASGDKKARPQSFLTELLGTSPIDPLELFLAKPRDRRAQIVAAMPVTVTPAQIAQWAPSLGAFDCAGHGLDVVERARQAVYERRAVANAAVKVATAEAERAAADATPAPTDAPSIEDATRALDEARRHYAELQSQERQAVEAETRTAATRARIRALRENAAAKGAAIGERPDDEIVAAAREAEKHAEAAVEAARATLARTEIKLSGARTARAIEEDRRQQWERGADERFDDERAASELESAIAASATPHVDAAAFALAREAGELAAAKVELAKAAQAGRESTARAAAAKAEAVRLQAAAAELDGQVKALSNDAPAALLAASDGIPGLTLDGDSVLLDGVAIESMGGAEQMRFAVAIARRANAKSRILVVDGLERVDPDLMDQFVREATRDGYQLIATRVDRGDVVFEAIEAAAEVAVAE